MAPWVEAVLRQADSRFLPFAAARLLKVRGGPGGRVEGWGRVEGCGGAHPRGQGCDAAASAAAGLVPCRSTSAPGAHPCLARRSSTGPTRPLQARHERSRSRTRERALLTSDQLAEAVGGAAALERAERAAAGRGAGSDAAAPVARGREPVVEAEAEVAALRAPLAWAVAFPLEVRRCRAGGGAAPTSAPRAQAARTPLRCGYSLAPLRSAPAAEPSARGGGALRGLRLYRCGGRRGAGA